MTVNELISKLATLDPELMVCYDDVEEGRLEITEVDHGDYAPVGMRDGKLCPWPEETVVVLS